MFILITTNYLLCPFFVLFICNPQKTNFFCFLVSLLFNNVHCTFVTIKNLRFKKKKTFYSQLEVYKKCSLIFEFKEFFIRRENNYISNTSHFKSHVPFSADRCSKCNYQWNSKYSKNFLGAIFSIKNKSQNPQNTFNDGGLKMMILK